MDGNCSTTLTLRAVTDGKRDIHDSLSRKFRYFQFVQSPTPPLVA